MRNTGRNTGNLNVLGGAFMGGALSNLGTVAGGWCMFLGATCILIAVIVEYNQ